MANRTSISSQVVSVPHGSQATHGEHIEGCAALQRNASRHYWPTAKPVVLEDVAGSRMQYTMSPDSVVSLTHAECEPAFICEDIVKYASSELANLGVFWQMSHFLHSVGLLMYWPVSWWCLHSLPLCWQTQQPFLEQLAFMCHLIWAALSEPLVWVADSISCYHLSESTASIQKWPKPQPESTAKHSEVAVVTT